MYDCWINSLSHTHTHSHEHMLCVRTNERAANKTNGHDYMLAKCNLIFRNVSLLRVSISQNGHRGNCLLWKCIQIRASGTHQAFVCPQIHPISVCLDSHSFVRIIVAIVIDVFVASCDCRFYLCCCCCCCHFSFQQDPSEFIWCFSLELSTSPHYCKHCNYINKP